ncbi:MAG: hypothetical protein WCT53_04505 [Candidatus Gracilibacteria bacterium]
MGIPSRWVNGHLVVQEGATEGVDAVCLTVDPAMPDTIIEKRASGITSSCFALGQSEQIAKWVQGLCGGEVNVDRLCPKEAKVKRNRGQRDAEPLPRIPVLKEFFPDDSVKSLLLRLRQLFKKFFHR